MEIKYNATGARRKELVKVIAAILNEKPVYLGTPSFAYKVGDIEVTRDGTLRLPDGMAAQPLTEALAKAGFHYEGEDAMNTAEEAGGEADADEAATETASEDVAAGAPALENVERPVAENAGAAVEPPAAQNEESIEPSPEPEMHTEGVGLTVELPAAQVNVELVEKLLEAKGGLIRKALGVTELPVETHEDKVAFPWFAEQPPEAERKAAIAFLSHLAAFSKHAKRVTAKAKPVTNEKYAFRCFLLRLLNKEKPRTMQALESLWYTSQGESYGRHQHYNGSRYHMLNLHATFTKGTIEFRLFQFDTPDGERKGGIHAGQLKSYIQLCLALSQMALAVTKASPKEQQKENPKYAMRTWLLRLGFIGDEFKTARDFLTRNLAGDTAFRHGR